MSENKNSLNNIADRIKAGLGKINKEVQAKVEGKSGSTQHDEPEIDNDHDGPVHQSSNERLSARDTDNSDSDYADIIEGEVQPVKPKKKGLDTKQKVLVVVACVAIGLWYTKQQNNTPAPAKPTTEEQHLEGFKPGNSTTTDIPGPAFNLEESSQHSTAPISVTPAASGEDDLGFGNAAPKDNANGPIGPDVLTADMNDQFGAAAEESKDELELDMFTGKVKTVATHPADLPAPVKQETAATAMLPAADNSPTPASGDLAMIGAPGDSPFGEGVSNSTGLSGNKNQNPDSKKGVLQDQSANADVSVLKAKIAEKDSRIGSLEADVSKLKNDLATAKHDLVSGKNSPAKQSSSKVNQHKPAQAAHKTQRSTPSQRVASAPKVAPRPQVCVTAVAQAARNCTTCVPHAFITHRGAETMVGQGDFLDGLRVNIVGDRLDLQNANGDVVHKFWSSPNGCAAG